MLALSPALLAATVACTPQAGQGELPATVDIGSTPSAAPAPADEAQRGKPQPAAASLTWEPSEASARLRARNRGLPLVIYVRADWSAASIATDRQVFSHPSVLAQSRTFVAFKLDVTAGEGDAELSASRHGVRGLPTTIVLDASGKEIAHLTGTIDAGTLLEAIKRAGER